MQLSAQFKLEKRQQERSATPKKRRGSCRRSAPYYVQK